MMTRSMKKRTSRSPDLPHELLSSKILARLPAKSLLRFSCACMLWFSTIGDPNFISARSKANPHLLGFFRNNYEADEDLYFKLLSNYSLVVDKVKKGSIAGVSTRTFVGACNGLICFHSWVCLHLLNLATREILVIRFPKYNDDYDKRSIGSKIRSYGFGYDRFKDEYKIVRISDANKFFMVYTLGTDSWRSIRVPPHISKHFERFLHISDSAVFSDGFLYWYTVPHVSDDTPMSEIFAFDIHSEEILPIPAPMIGKYRMPLFDRQGCLCFTDCHESDKVSECSLYTLSKDNNIINWVKESISYPLADTVIPSEAERGVVAFLNEVLLHWIDGGVLSVYNLHTGANHELEFPLVYNLHPFNQVLRKKYQFLNHAENLLSLETFIPPGGSQVKYLSLRKAQEDWLSA